MLSLKRVNGHLQDEIQVTSQVEEFMYLWVLLKSGGRIECEIDTHWCSFNSIVDSVLVCSGEEGAELQDELFVY